MSQMRNEEVQKIMKGCIIINAFILFFAIQPFGSLITADTIISDLVTQTILAPCLIGLLVPLGINKRMKQEGLDGHSWSKNSFDYKMTRMIPKNVILRSILWTILALVVTIPSMGFIYLFDIQSMTAMAFVPFKLTQAFIFCTFISYFIITFTVTNFFKVSD